KSFLYGYEPAFLEKIKNCGWGNNMLFGMDENGKITYKVAAYYGIYMLTHYWAQPTDSILKVFPATCNIVNKKKQPLVTAYAILGPGNKWSVALINKDPKKTWQVDLQLVDS